jgi:hypothetical protein
MRSWVRLRNAGEIRKEREKLISRLAAKLAAQEQKSQQWRADYHHHCGHGHQPTATGQHPLRGEGVSEGYDAVGGGVVG